MDLDVSINNISDAGLQHLRYLTSLKNLYVRECELSDDGLDHLLNLTGLIFVDISYDRNISNAGFWSLLDQTMHCQDPLTVVGDGLDG